MKYEAPELRVLTPAISAIQDPHIRKSRADVEDTDLLHGALPAYHEWE